MIYDMIFSKQCRSEHSGTVFYNLCTLPLRFQIFRETGDLSLCLEKNVI